MLRQPPALAQILQHLAHARARVEPAFVQAPQGDEGLVEEGQALVRPVDRGGGLELLQHLGMGVHMAAKLCLGQLLIGQVDGVADQRRFHPVGQRLA